MYSRKILDINKDLLLLIDSISINSLLDKKDLRTQKLLSYVGRKPFIFFRFPLKTNNHHLNNIPELKIKYDSDKNMKRYSFEDSEEVIYFRKKTKDIIDMTKDIIKKDTLKDLEIDLAKLIFLQADISRVEKIPIILVTDNKIFLENRDLLGKHLFCPPLSIVYIEEAIEIAGLYSRFQNNYYLCQNSKINKGGWYDLAFQKTITNFSYSDPILRGLSMRFVHLLMSLDEMGFQYFLGVNHDTHQDMIYHYYYSVSLIRGIFDSLAMKTKIQYKIEFSGDKHPSSISLSGKEFLNKIKENNPELRNHISRYMNHINLINEIRELVLHREMFEYMTVVDQRGEIEKKLNLLKLNEEVYRIFNNFKKVKIKYHEINDWGLYENDPTFKLLDIYYFSKKIFNEIKTFSKEYLRLLGYEDKKIEELPKWIRGNQAVFNECSLFGY